MRVIRQSYRTGVPAFAARARMAPCWMRRALDDCNRNQLRPHSVRTQMPIVLVDHRSRRCGHPRCLEAVDTGGIGAVRCR